jgi:hypothetical protein
MIEIRVLKRFSVKSMFKTKLFYFVRRRAIARP